MRENIRFRDKNLWGKIKEIIAVTIVLCLIFGVPTGMVIGALKDHQTMENIKDNPLWQNILFFALMWALVFIIMTFIVGMCSALSG